MRLLLDTHVLLWWLEDDVRLSARARRAIADAGSDIWVSAASVWECAIKQRIGRLRVVERLLENISANGFEPLPITFAHAASAGTLPRHHGDSFDRMLVAQAQLEGLTLVSRDARLAPYGVSLLRA